MADRCCFCVQELDSGARDVVTLKATWNDTSDWELWWAHEQCWTNALHPERRTLISRAPGGGSWVASYVEGERRQEWNAIALAAGFDEPEEYPIKGTADDLLDLEQIMDLTDCSCTPKLEAVMSESRTWAPEARQAVVEEAARYDITPWAVTPDVIAIVLLLARPVEPAKLKGETRLADELINAISGVANDRSASA